MTSRASQAAEQPDQVGGPARTAGPDSVHSLDDLVRELESLRRLAARGSGRSRISLTELALRTGLPRSTVHVYLTGRGTPPADALDLILLALNVKPAQLRGWAEALERVVAARRPPRARPDPSRPPEPLRLAARQLPAVTAGFTGRDAELAWLDDLMLVDEPTARVVVALSGPGGVGKSSLVAVWAHRNRARFPDGQLWIDLNGFGPHAPLTPATALGRLLRSVGVGSGVDSARLPADVEARAALFRTAVADRRLLLVLDNAASAAQVRPLLPGSPDCTVIVTSRAELPGLAVQVGAVRVRVRPLRGAAARRLLGPHVPVEVADRLVGYCAGLPLALRISAELIAGCSPPDVRRFADELADRGARLDALTLPDGGAELSLRTVLAASYAALTSAEAQLFRLLPLCLGHDIALDSAAACLGQDRRTTRRLLTGLAAANLLDSLGGDRFAMDDLVASFAEELLMADDGEAAAAQDRLLRQLLARADAVCCLLGVSRRLTLPSGLSKATFRSRAEARSWMSDTLELAVRASRRALDTGAEELAWPLLNRVLQASVYRLDLARFAEPLRAAADVAAACGRTREQAVMWRGLGVCAALGGDYAAASEAFTTMERLAGQLDDPSLQDVAEANVALTLLLSGHPRESIRRLQRVVPRRERLGEPTLDLYNAVTTAWVMLGDLDRAQSAAEQGLRLASSVSAARTTVAIAHFTAGGLALERDGDGERALRLVRDGWRALGEISDDNATVMGATVQATALFRLGRFDEAARLLDQTTELAARTNTPEAVDSAVVRGQLLACRGSPAEAIVVLQSAVRRAERLGLPYHQASARYVLAAALRDAGDARRALEQARTALSLSQRCEFGRLEQRCLDLLAASA